MLHDHNFLYIDKAVWQQNRDIANEEVKRSEGGRNLCACVRATIYVQVLLQVLEEGSIEGARTLLKEAQSPSVKSQLHSNTSRLL